MRDLWQQAKNQDYRALAKVLSAVEKDGVASFQQWPELYEANNPCLRLGITGPPGAGKSTLVGQLIRQFRNEGKTVAVLAVDPSSPFTKGAILADRIRYSEHYLDSGVYIRSVGSRGSLGGLSASAYLMLRVFDHCQFDVVLIETVGVGQSEYEIMHVADQVAVVLVPESGDSVQAMKAGLMEIADVFVVNKSDRPGAAAMAKELEASVQLGEKPTEVFETVATEGNGVSELAQHFLSIDPKTVGSVLRADPSRLQAEAVALVRMENERHWQQPIRAISNPPQFKAFLQSLNEKN